MNGQILTMFLNDISSHYRHFVLLCRQFMLYRDKNKAFDFGFTAFENELFPLEIMAVRNGCFVAYLRLSMIL